MHISQRLRAVTTVVASTAIALTALTAVVPAAGAAGEPLPERRLISTTTPTARQLSVWEGPTTSMQASITSTWGRPALRVVGVSSGTEVQGDYLQFADEEQIRPGTFRVRPHVPEADPMAVDEVGVGGCTDASGTLTVHELDRGAGTTVLHAAVDYDVTCGVDGPRTAQYRFASSVPYRAATLTIAAPPQPWSLDQVVPVVVRYTNTGTAGITVSSAELAAGRDEADWTLADDGCSGRLVVPGASCDVALRVVPSEVREPAVPSTSTSLSFHDDWGPQAWTRSVEGSVSYTPQPRDVTAVGLVDGTFVQWSTTSGRAPGSFVVEGWSGSTLVRWARVGAEARSYVDRAYRFSRDPQYRYRVVAEPSVGGQPAVSAMTPPVRLGDRQVVMTALDAQGGSWLKHVNTADLTSASERVDADVTSAPTVRAPGEIAFAGSTPAGADLLRRNGIEGTVPVCVACGQQAVVAPTSSPALRGHAWTTFDGRLRVVDESQIPPRVTTIAGVGQVAQASWARDATTLVVSDTAGGPLRRVRLDAALGALSGPPVTVAGTAGARAPAAAPRRDDVAYLTGTGTGTVLGLAPTSGSGAPRVLAVVPGAVHVSWWPDASAVIVTARSAGVSTVERIDVATGARQVLHTTGDTVLGAVVKSLDQEAPVITFGAAPTHRAGVATVPFTITDDTRPAGGLGITCSLDGGPEQFCGPDGWSGRVRVGTHTLTVRAAHVSFVSTTMTKTWTTPATQRSSDFTGDGRPDLLARDGTGRLYLYPGNGLGSFLARRAYGTGWNAMSVMAVPGDFSGDGRTDLLAVDRTPTLRLYRGDGAGGLGASSAVQVGWSTRMVGIGDLDGDGATDLIRIEDGGQMIVFPGNGRGGVQPGRPLGSGWNAMTALVAAGDLTGDGYPDLLARDRTGRLHLYPADGAGGFRARVSYGTGWNAMTALVGPGDFSGDGNADLLARDTTGRLHLYPGNGAGGFKARVSYGTGWNAMTAIVG